MDIQNNIGLDANQALSTLSQLTRGLATFEQQAVRTSLRLNSLTGSSNQAGTALSQLGRGSGAALAQLQAINLSTVRLTTSFGLLSRIVFTQAIVRGLSIVRNELKATASEAVDFQRQIALIRTIDDSKASFDTISQSLHKLSDDLNISLKDVGAGVFQSISNQVGDFKQSLDFAKTAGQFAKATGSTMADSVDLLSGALKSFNLDVADSDRVAGTFFKTIDLGRVNASQLANAFGRVGPIAATLGVDLDEVSAAIAAISVRGTNTAESLTQVRAIMSALLKPSDSMKEALKGLGFDSGEAAIKTLGFEGTLRALSKSTGGSSAQLAQLFQNVRGLAGTAALTGDDLKSLADDIDEMKTAGRNFAKEKFLEATATDAEKATAEVNKLKNAVVVELGQGLLQAGVNLSNFVGGADSVVTAARNAGPAIGGLVAGFVALRSQTLLTNAGLATTARLLGPAGIVAAAAGAAVALRGVFQDVVTQNALQTLRDAEQHQEKVLASFALNEKAKQDAARASDEAQAQSVRQRVQEANKLYQQDLANAKTVSQKKAALENFQGRIGFKATGQEDALRQIDAGIQQRAAQRAAESAARQQQARATSIRSEIDSVFKGIDERSPLRNKLLLGNNDAKQAFEGVTGLLRQVSSQAKISAEDIDALDTAVKKLAEANKSGSFEVSSAIGRELPNFAEVIGKLRDLNLASQVTPAVSAAQQLRQELEGAATAASKIQIPRTTVGRALGGVMHLARGGRGTDTIPAMLSPGEFVVNARSSARFFSQLQSINAGQAPAFRQDGGNVTTTNIGDVVINGFNAKGGTSPQQARELANSIHRELRKRTLRPF